MLSLTKILLRLVFILFINDMTDSLEHCKCDEYFNHSYLTSRIIKTCAHILNHSRKTLTGKKRIVETNKKLPNFIQLLI